MDRPTLRVGAKIDPRTPALEPLTWLSRFPELLEPAVDVDVDEDTGDVAALALVGAWPPAVMPAMDLVPHGEERIAASVTGAGAPVTRSLATVAYCGS